MARYYQQPLLPLASSLYGSYGGHGHHGCGKDDDNDELLALAAIGAVLALTMLLSASGRRRRRKKRDVNEGKTNQKTKTDKKKTSRSDHGLGSHRSGTKGPIIGGSWDDNFCQNGVDFNHFLGDFHFGKFTYF